MAYSRFVRPETVTLPISGGDTLTVKRRLTHGERTAAYQRMYVFDAAGTATRTSLTAEMAMVLAYLVDWTLTDEGRPVPIKGQPLEDVEAALNALDDLDYAEISAAIQAHEVAMLLERQAQKKTAGLPPSRPISESPSAADGHSTTSVN
jgi:pectin methylesterase-like acyl-CoA thioesterase